MSFLDKNGLQVLTNKLVQGDAIKVASHRGHTVKNVIDNITRECENVATPNTMNLENRINEFKVGQGRDLDVSGDVEEGKIEVGLSGRTYQNLLMPNLDKADNEGYVMYPKGEYKTYPDKNNYKRDAHMIKPNTTYTFIVDIKSIAKGMSLEINFAHSNHCFNYIAISEGIGVYKIKAVSKSDLSECTRIIGDRVKLGTYEEDTVYRIILLEGDYTQTPIEELPKYFEGIKSSFEDGVVDVEVVGKNLVSKATEWRSGVIDSNTGIYSDRPSGTRYTSNLIYNHSGKELYIRSKGQMWNYLYFYDENKNYLGFCTNQGMGSNYNFNINFDNSKRIAKYFIISFGNKDALEIGEVYEYRETDYITPYKKKISFNIGEPLRSLPDGICDEIRNDNGRWELVRRIGKANAVDIKHWYKLATYEKTILYRWYNSTYDGKYKAKPSCSGWCNTIPYYKPKGENDTAFCRINDVGPYGALVFAIEKSKLDQDKPDPTQWFSENPTTFYYQLADPIITQIEPIEFEVKPLATMTINSEIAPTSNHKVVLNRAGQIEQGIIQIAELKSRVDALETAYDSYLLETQHKLSILGFEYELESEEI